MDGNAGSFLKANPVGKRTSFAQEDKMIDIRLFEGNVPVATAPTDPKVNIKHFPSEAPDSRVRLKHWDLHNPTRKIPYVIGLSPGKTFDNFRHPVVFSEGLERMHKLLFNTALETLLVCDSGEEEVVGKREVTSIGIVVIPIIAHILAGFLGLVVICLGGVFLIS